MLDWRLAAFASAGITVLTALTVRTGPVLAGRTRVSRRSHERRRKRFIRPRPGGSVQALVVVEVAIALLLMTGAGLLVRTLGSLNNVDAGYRADSVVAMNIRLPFRRLVTAMPGEIEAYRRCI